MNLRQTIAKQQEVWIARLDGEEHGELDCAFCHYTSPAWCSACPVAQVLLPNWDGDVVTGTGCSNLSSWSKWSWATTRKARAAAARLVLDDVNRIARHYHYPVRVP